IRDFHVTGVQTCALPIYRSAPRGIQMDRPVRLAVRDSGPGIAPEVEHRLFDPFVTTKSGGSGLGLAVVHRAVEAHAGVIFVERAVEGGAQFVIFIPGLPDRSGGATESERGQDT